MLYFLCLIVLPMWSIIFTVPLLAFSCYDTSLQEILVFISASTSLMFSITVVVSSYFNIILSILRIRSSEKGKEPSPHVLHIWQLCQSSMELCFSCICSLKITIHWILIKWPPCFIHWWSPCWIPWSTAWGTRTWRLPWGYFWQISDAMLKLYRSLKRWWRQAAIVWHIVWTKLEDKWMGYFPVVQFLFWEKVLVFKQKSLIQALFSNIKMEKIETTATEILGMN